MKWSPQEIRCLRLQLGWSAADLGRRLGCTTQIVMQWECGDIKPDPEMQNHFHYLSNFVEQNALRLARTPHAEALMNQEQLSQVTHDVVALRVPHSN
ncbi:MAG: multiprotein-bridging factor 1 family protein [Bdellovibrionales bacterium]